MTLSQWFKFYLFNPLLMLLMSCFPAPALTAYLGVLAFFITFLVMGVWHGTTAVFVDLRIADGCWCQHQQALADRLPGALGQEALPGAEPDPGYIYFARGVTIGYFVSGLDMPVGHLNLLD